VLIKCEFIWCKCESVWVKKHKFLLFAKKISQKKSSGDAGRVKELAKIYFKNLILKDK